MKLLTVILLTYNHEKTIAKAFESILEQQTNFEFDIFVLEDCSTDRTAHICKEYKKKHPDKITLFLNEKNFGVTRNFKQGLLNVKSKYFAFLEGDDYWCDRKKLQKQVDVLNQHPECTMCGHDTLVRDLVKRTQWLFSSVFNYEKKEKYNVSEDFRVHPSSRLYRNVIDISAIPHYMLYDTRLYLLYLLKGDMVFIDSIMSVYNITGSGFWTRRNKTQQRLLSLKLDYQTNRFLNHIIPRSHSSQLINFKPFNEFEKSRVGWIIAYYFKMLKLRFRLAFEWFLSITIDL
jgi:glycosyltransferase involved in cell wall biosynthesis